MMDVADAIIKAERYCAYQERAPHEVEEKLKGFGLSNSQIKKIIRELSEEGFIDEKRFARTFAKSKFRNNKWGKIKIRQHLLSKKIDNELVEKGLDEIPADEYRKTIRSLIMLKSRSLDETDEFIRNHKVAAYLIQKGFESDAVWAELKGSGF